MISARSLTLIVSSSVLMLVRLAGAPQAAEPRAKLIPEVIKGSDCGSCHAADRALVGPAYSAMAKRYSGQSDGVEKIATKIRDGGSTMPPHPNLTDAQRVEMAKWILSVSGSDVSKDVAFPHTLKDGTTVVLDFPVYTDTKGADDKANKVTKEIFHGYQLFNSYCYRCHGTDATGGQLAPDLRRSLTSGMNMQQFSSIAVTGKADKGMPAWAGFLSADDIVHIYQYTKGRSLDLVPSGRPPSLQD
jgi:cytochrome c